MGYYDYDYTTYQTDNSGSAAILAILGTYWIITLVIGVLLIVSLWKLYKKAGKQGWECIIPVYNIIVLLEITSLPTWNIILFFIPIANIYIGFKVYIELAHKFGKSTGFGVLTVFFPVICIPILAFSKNCNYEGLYTNQFVNNNMNNMNNYNNMNNNNNMNNYNNMNNNPINPVKPVNPINPVNPVNPGIQQPTGQVESISNQINNNNNEML